MKEKAIQILQPEYVKEFICDGKNCEDNCCEGIWNIYIDKKHYNKIKKVKFTSLEGKIKKYIKRNRANKSIAKYGKVVQDKE